MKAVKPGVSEDDVSINILCGPLVLNWKLNEKWGQVIKSTLMQSVFLMVELISSQTSAVFDFFFNLRENSVYSLNLCSRIAGTCVKETVKNQGDFIFTIFTQQQISIGVHCSSSPNLGLILSCPSIFTC